VSEAFKPKRTLGIYLIITWMAINAILFLILIPGDQSDLNNYIEPILWVASIAGLLTMRKAGAAFATSVLNITLSTSTFNVLIGYYTSTLGEPFAPINALRIIINAIAIIYLFKLIFANKFK
jgi:hypothetical protein